MSTGAGAFKLSEYVFKSRAFLLEMVQRRGFSISEYEYYTNTELNTLLLAHESNNFNNLGELGPLDMLFTKKDEKLMIKYRLDEKFRERENMHSQVEYIYEHLLKKGDCLIILNIARIYTDTKTGSKTDSGSEEFVKRYYSTKNYFIQIYGLENFLFNVSAHQSVPLHEIATTEEVKTLLATTNTKLSNLPVIKWLDPQAKYLGIKPKSVVKIISSNASTGLSIKYRVCTY
jgi:DNA-directed RNA polymerase subunit H (RpoH/RPB5)